MGQKGRKVEEKKVGEIKTKGEKICYKVEVGRPGVGRWERVPPVRPLIYAVIEQYMNNEHYFTIIQVGTMSAGTTRTK